MVKVRLTSKESYIWDGDSLYVFALNGACVQEKAPPLMVATLGLLPLPIISVLSTNGKTDIGVFHSNLPMEQYFLEEDAVQVVLRLQKAKGFLRMLTRQGSIEGNAFNQVLFVYSEVTCMQQYSKIARGIV